MEMKDFNYKVYNNVIEITLKEPVEPNTTYEFIFEDIMSLDKKHTLKKETVKMTTLMSPMYTTIDSVKSLLNDRMVDSTTILLSIRDASRYVDYITGQTFAPNLPESYRIKKMEASGIPFAAGQYVKYRAAYESILKKYSETAELAGNKGQIGKVSFETTMPDLRPLLDELKGQMVKWEMELMGGNKAYFSSAIKGVGAKQQLGGMPNSFARGAMDYGMARPRYTKYH